MKDLAKRYLAAQLVGDRAEAVRLVISEGLKRGIPMQELLLGVLQPAQREIGRLWQENQVTIAQEHLATAISQLVLARLYEEMQRAPQAEKTVLLACVQGETHEIGARMASDILESAGFRVRFLGADVPALSVIEVIKREKPDLLALSATLCFHEESLCDTVRQVVTATGGKLPILVGGSIVEWAPGLLDRLREETKDLGSEPGEPFIEVGRDARDLITIVKRALHIDDAGEAASSAG